MDSFLTSSNDDGKNNRFVTEIYFEQNNYGSEVH